MSQPPFQNARLTWQDNQPHSAEFEDIYFSSDSGIDETRFVFLAQNQLAERWRQLNCSIFTIAETGFGTGLNFLCAWQLWQQLAPSQARLHFVSCEKYPLTLDDLRKALLLWPTLSDFSTALIQQYRMLCSGWNQLKFDHGRVTLTLLIGDAMDTLPQMNAKVDAWFLDGFSPAKNPDLWQPALFKQMARLSCLGTTFATFTSAGIVRRGLSEAGFAIEKISGFGKKREMLRGQYIVESKPHRIKQPAKTIAVIGGGIAGCSTAYAFATKGYQVTLIERHPRLASEASGNHQAALYPRLSAGDNAASHLALLGFKHTLNLLHALGSVAWDQCGLLQLGFNAREVKRLNDLSASGFPADLLHSVNAQQASELADIALSHEGIWFASGGWLSPTSFCESLALHPNIQIKTSLEAIQLEYLNAQWQISSANETVVNADTVVLCNANDVTRFSQTAHLPLSSVRGQVSLLAPNSASQALNCVVCTGGYITPSYQNQHCLGASFSPDEVNLEIRTEDHQANLTLLKQISPTLADSFKVQVLQGRVALRSRSPDYLPLVGELLNAQTLTENTTPAFRIKAAELNRHQGLYVNVGHGSKGMITAPLCAELLASHMIGAPLPMAVSLAKSLDPNRFILKSHELKRLIGADFE